MVILDLGLPLLNGMKAGKQLKRPLPLTKIVVLTMNEDISLADQALRHWASAYLLKTSSGSELVKAVNEVLHHKTYVTSRIAHKLDEGFVRYSISDHHMQLTKRQTEVIQLLVEGYTIKEVGTLLNIQSRTVEFHKYKIMHRYGLKTIVEFIMFAINHHIVESPGGA